jgi:hypothetical protein
MAPASTTIYEAAAHSRDRPPHLLGGFDSLLLPEHILRFQVSSGF